MYNTPSSRTSKHGAPRKRNNRKAQQHSLIQPPITTLPERAAMFSPPGEATTVDEESHQFIADTPEMDLLQLRSEDELEEFVQEAPAHSSGEDGGDESGVPAEWDDRHENGVDLGFVPFSGEEDAREDAHIHNTPYEFREESEPEAEREEPEPLRLGADRRTESGYGALSDIMEGAQSEELETSRGRIPDVTRLDSPPVSPRGSGRTRAPILVKRNPTSPSSLSRQLQNVQSFLPASPQLPSLGFSNPLTNFAAPRISNVTVSGSSFNQPTSQPSIDPFLSAKEARRRSTGNFGETKDRDRTRLRMTPQRSKSSESEGEDVTPQAIAAKHMHYPTTAVGSDKVVFASFTALSYPSPSSTPRRLLFVGYENGLQIWDTTHLGEVREVLNRRISGAVVGCSVLPAPRTRIGRGSISDDFSPMRPLVGIVIEEHDASYLLVYSLTTHQVVKKLDFSGATVTSVQASNSFIVVSTTSPSSLHILCSRTLNILHTIQARQLSIFSRPVSLHTPEGSVETIYTARQDRPHAVFALSSRLLAFASVSPSPESSSLTSIYPRMAVPQAPSIQLGSLNVTQADIGNAAMKVGGGLLSGMKTLGGIAVAAARGERNNSVPADSGGLRKFFSRSAPAATSSSRHGRSASSGSSVFGNTGLDNTGHDNLGISPPQTATSSSANSAHITILDLQPLLDDPESGRPELLSDFSVPSGQVVAGLKFSEDGTGLSVVPDDGGVLRVYQIKPPSRVMRSASLNSSILSARDKLGQGPVRKDSAGSTEGHSALGEASTATAPWHVYDLRRGRTTGIIEAVSHSYDGRWVGISTRKRTIHMFATNPYGGKPDDASHTEGRVKNVNEIPLSTEVRPIVRLRSNPVSSQDQFAIPLAFTFISSSFDSLPSKFLPSHNTTFSPSSSVSSSIPSSLPHRRTQSVSPRLPPRPTNYQDILVFDPADGSLSLRRLTISTRIGEASSSFLASLPIPAATSISLPGMGFMGRPSASPPKPSAFASTPTAERLPTELVAKDSTVATWNLIRDSKWNDVKEPLVVGQELHQEQRRTISKSEWLAQAELSTCSRSTLILPGSVYLSHQFSFFALDGDYHALIRRLHFDIPVEKIDVRREVEASAHVTGHGSSFVSGAAISPQDLRAGRSFDEPLASAIYTGLEYSSSSPPVIPMLPNGARSGPFNAAIPIRNVAAGLTEGVNESFGRLSRGFRKVRSPRMNPVRSDESVPLEFDEEDETFLSDHRHDNDNDTMSNSGYGRDSQSVSTPSTNNNAPLPGVELEPDAGWLDGIDAVEEAEQFDEISAARLMDEEPEEPLSIKVPAKGRSIRKGGRGKG